MTQLKFFMIKPITFKKYFLLFTVYHDLNIESIDEC